MTSSYDIGKITGLILLVAVIVVTTAALAFAITSQEEKTYTASAQAVVVAGLGTTTNGDVLTAPRIGQTYATLARTRPVLLEVIKRAALPYTPEELDGHLTLSVDPASPFLGIAATDPSPIRAQATANALADILVERATVPAIPGSTVPPTPDTPARKILEIVQRAVVPVEPSGPRVLFNTTLAAATALVLVLTVLAVMVYLGSEQAAKELANE